MALSTLLALLLIPVDAVRADELIVDAGRGPVTVHLPESYESDGPSPLLLVLHGYGAPDNWQELFPRLGPLAEQYGFVYVLPNGLPDDLGMLAWNGAGCCGEGNDDVDDVGYLSDLIVTISATLDIDLDRIHLLGLSNGGFMAHALACARADLVSGFASLAGATWLDPALCQPTEAVHLLQIQGTEDELVLYDGTEAWPGALQTVATWVDLDGCSPESESLPPFNADQLVPGLETQVTRWRDGCAPGGSAELWSMVGSGHGILPSVAWGERIMDWFMLHPEPGTWTDLGGALAGASGPPTLSGAGAQVALEPTTLTLTAAPPSTPVWFVLGLSAAYAPFAGGVLVPAPDVILDGFGTDAEGGLSLTAPWPHELPADLSLVWQAWLPDGAAPAGLAASNGLESVAP